MDLLLVRKKLAKRLAQLHSDSQAAKEAQAPVALDQQAVGRVSRGDALQCQAIALATQASRLNEIRQVRAAIVRLDADEYGVCQDCGSEIAEARLKANPYALFCIACANRLEAKS